jgi:acetyl-CoA synthetase
MIQPLAAIAAKAHVRSLEEYQRQYRLSIDDPEGFWQKQAEILTWFHPPQQIFDADLREVDFSWYGGGRLNACHTASIGTSRRAATSRRSSGRETSPATTARSPIAS